MNWIVTGDTHRNFSRFDNLKGMPESTAIIILGDVGLNYTLDKNDYYAKKALCKNYPYMFYCVRGNHEARPSDIEGMKLSWDVNVSGMVWYEEDFPNIRYFQDWGVYRIDGLRTLVIGGAYSVDKHYRLATGRRWFENEQLSLEEMNECERHAIQCPKFDLVLSHTCPRSVQPTDLFLNFIDQSLVDSSMEDWMDRLARKIEWRLWLFGHYHSDRIEWPRVEQFSVEMECLQDIIARWDKYSKTGELDWWLPLSPKMKRIVEEKNEKV